MKNKLEAYTEEMEQTFQKGISLIEDLNKGESLTKEEKNSLGVLSQTLSDWETELTLWLEENEEPVLKKAS